MPRTVTLEFERLNQHLVFQIGYYVEGRRGVTRTPSSQNQNLSGIVRGEINDFSITFSLPGPESCSDLSS